MAPTEVLARQHHQTLQRLAAPAGVEIGLLTGREKGRARDSMLASLASGLTPVVVGTHALLQPDVEFRDLALVVIDEQHRFGVEQRLGAGRQGARRRHAADERDADPAHPDDDRLRRSRRLAPDRQAAGTAAGRYAHRAARPHRGGHRRRSRARCKRGAKVFWVCPMVEESENADIAAAEERYRALRSCCRAGSGWCTAA